LAEHLIAQFGVSRTFTILGLIYLLAVAGAGLLMRDPPEDYRPAGWQPQASHAGQQSGTPHTLKEALHSWQWYGLWGILFLNSVAGISIISQASPMAQELTGASAVAAAGLVGIISIGNGAGRLLWAWFSDFAGRRRVFLMMFVTQAIVFGVLSRVHSFGVLAFLAFLVLLCYGGGFGTMPAFAADFFGAQNVGPIYGLMLTAWGAAGVVGPSLIAWVRQTSGNYTDALELIAGIMLVSVVLPFIISPPKPPAEVSSHASAGGLKDAFKAPTR
jgi:OFA family oxalate/formate antiporter-like MFS transporter